MGQSLRRPETIAGATVFKNGCLPVYSLCREYEAKHPRKYPSGTYKSNYPCNTDVE